MAHTPTIVHVEPGSALDRALDDVEAKHVVVERRGVRYRLDRIGAASDEDIWANYDPEAAIAGMRAAAGSWSDIDAEAFKEFIYRAREEGSRPPDRP